MKYSAIAAALATLLVSSAASANPQGNSVAAKPAVQEKTYCFQFGLDTGSRINRVECKTKKEWAQLGIDVDELVGK